MKIFPIDPFGAVVEADIHNQSLLEIASGEILDILEKHPLLVFRNFCFLSDDEYIAFAKQFGPLLAWEFGQILELKTQAKPANHIFTTGRVELHWDGAFVKETPHYNLFQCLQGADEKAGGETLFVDTTKVWHGANQLLRDNWEAITIEYSTEKKAHYGGNIREPLVSASPYNDETVIRYIEAFNEDNEEINPMSVKVDNYDTEQSDSFLKNFTKRLYQNDVMYRHRWQAGDFLIADNSCLLHGRSRFTTKQVDRHIKRINIL